MNNLKKEHIIKYCTLFLICFTYIKQGLLDYDYFWQSYLGKLYIQSRDKYITSQLLWGDKYKLTYCDHEWLSNILFYLFSSIGQKGALILQLFLCCVIGVCIVLLVHKFSKSIEGLNFFIFLFYLFMYAITYIQIKPYVLSVAFLCFEILILYNYKEQRNIIKTFCYTILVVLLWNNIHSGSVVLYFVFGFLFWLIHLREKKSIFIGIADALVLLINPYGYKLLVTNFTHNFDTVMKMYNGDWTPLNTHTNSGLLGVICLLLCIILYLIYSKKEDLYSIVGFICVAFLAFSSGRHFMYSLPFVVLCLQDIQISVPKVESRLNKREIHIALLLAMLSIVIFNCISIKQMSGFTKDYLHIPINNEFQSVLIKTNSTEQENEGLFCGLETDFVYDFNIKPFYCGAYLVSPERWQDSYVLLNLANTTQITNIINKYGLTKFFISKQSLFAGYTFNNTLYDYLLHNDNYICLIEDDTYAYFVMKE